MKKIPLHCIVLLVGPIGSGKTTWAHQSFSSHEILSFADLRLELCGDSTAGDQLAVVWSELFRRSELRVANGQRVIVDATNLKTKDRLDFCMIAEKYGVECIYIPFELNISDLQIRNPTKDAQMLAKSHHTWLTVKSQVLTGDQKRAVVLAQNTLVVKDATITADKILAVGDVHGDWDSMCKAVDLAKSHTAHIVWLGDVVDYGRQNLKCMRLAYETVKTGEASMIWGNHERKIDRWIQNDFGASWHGRLSDANLCTINEITSISADRQRKFLSAWTALRNWSRNHLVVDKFLFTHGAATPNMWTQTTRRLTHQDSNMAFFGEVDSAIPVKSDGYPNRVWNWVKDIPADHTVIVGHDWLDRITNSITIKTNEMGGKALVVDCGSSKGGRLGAVLVNLADNITSPCYFET